MANGSCPLAHWECFQAQGASSQAHTACPTESLSREALAPATRENGKQWDAEQEGQK